MACQNCGNCKKPENATSCHTEDKSNDNKETPVSTNIVSFRTKNTPKTETPTNAPKMN